MAEQELRKSNAAKEEGLDLWRDTVYHMSLKYLYPDGEAMTPAQPRFSASCFGDPLTAEDKQLLIDAWRAYDEPAGVSIRLETVISQVQGFKTRPEERAEKVWRKIQETVVKYPYLKYPIDWVRSELQPS